MTFFHDLNKRLADLATKQDAKQLAEHAAPAAQSKSKLAQALNERDLGKHNNATTGFAALAKKTGGGEKGARIAGAQLAKMRAKGQVEEGDMEEGNAFTGALASTPKGGSFKLGDKTFKDTSNLEEGMCPTCNCSLCKCNNGMTDDLDRIGELAGLGQSMMEDLQADDGKHYRSFDDFVSLFDPDSFDDVEEHSAGREIRGYINGKCVMSWEFDDESMTSGWGNYDMTMLEDDELYGRAGINSVNKTPRPGQTNFREIPAGNHPGSKNKFSDEYRSSHPERLKHAIKKSLGKHAEPNLPESMASMLNRLDELSEGTGYTINGKPVDMRSIVIAGGSFNDSSDTYAEYAEFTNGTPLNDAELDMLSDDSDLMSKLHLKENVSESGSGIQAKYLGGEQFQVVANGETYQLTATALEYMLQPWVKDATDAVDSKGMMTPDKMHMWYYVLAAWKIVNVNTRKKPNRSTETAIVNYIDQNHEDDLKQVAQYQQDWGDDVREGATMPKTDPAINLDVLDPNAVGNRGMGRSTKEKIKTRLGRNVYGDLNAAAGEPRSRYYADKPHLPEQGMAESTPKDPNAPKLVQDRKTGKWYDPNKEFDKKMNSPEVMAQMKRMAQKGGVAEGTKKQNEGNAFSKAVQDAKRDGIQKGEKIRVGGKELPLKELDLNLLKGAQGSMKSANPDSESERNRHKKYGYRSDRDDTGNDNDYDQYGNLKNKKKSAAVSDGPKKKGRPAKEKQPERVTGKSYKYKSGRPSQATEGLDSDGVMMTRPSNMSSEGIEHGEQAEYNDEAGMTKDSLHTIVRHARELEKCLRQNENLPEWVQEKVGQIKGMMSSVTDYILSTHERDAEQHMGREGIALERAVSKDQAVAARIARGVQKGEVKAKPGSASATMAKMAPKELKKFAKTPTKGLPKQVEEESTDREDQRAERAGKRVAKDIEHDEGHRGRDDNKAEKAGKKVTKDIEYDDKKDRKEKKVDETTTSGSVAPAQNAAPKAGKGMQFGKGVYESLDRQLTQALTESIAIESKMEECGDGEMAPGITITADGEEAAKLMMLLKLAGLENQIPSACPSCGGSPCGCAEVVDENAPDWPTNTEKLDADPNLRTYSGGLNGPKSTGQTTVPVVASQLRRQASMEESVKLEQSLFNTWKKYKG